jgi:methionyl-tRNA formyltransferase
MAKKIIFMGTPMFAVPILKSLYQNGYPVTCVYTQPPQKSHRGQKINKSPVQGISETLNLDYNGQKQLLKAEGLLATCIQHEMDHLEGILFIDYLSKLKKSMIIKKLSKLKSNTAEV